MLLERKADTAADYAAALPVDSGSYVMVMPDEAAFIAGFSALRPDIEVVALGGVGPDCPATFLQASA